MVKVLGIATIPAGLIVFDSMSLDDRGFQVGEEVSDLLECKTLASFEFAVGFTRDSDLGAPDRIAREVDIRHQGFESRLVVGIGESVEIEIMYVEQQGVTG
jgi:hypothetical protein